MILGIVVALLMTITFNIKVTEAFSTSVHVEIDNKAFTNLFPSTYSQLITSANVMQDLHLSEPKYHGDRISGETHEIAFNRTRDYIISQKKIIIDLINNRDINEAASETGKALHAIQDFYSHSNFVELNEADRITAKAAFINSDIRMPFSIKMGGFWIDLPWKPLPCSDNGSKYSPEDPLKYSHENHNKDSGSPVGRPNDYAWATGNATQHTIEFIKQTWETYLTKGIYI